MVRHEGIGDHLKQTLSEMAMRHIEQLGCYDRSSIKAACQMLIILGIDSRDVYEEYFERPFLIRCAAFYKVERQRLLADNSESGYVEKAKERITEEDDRVRRCFPDDQITVQKIVELVTDVFLNENLKTVVEDTNDIVAA